MSSRKHSEGALTCAFFLTFPLLFPRQGRILNVLGCLWNFYNLTVTSGCPFLDACRQSIWMQCFLTGCVQESDPTSSSAASSCCFVVINGCCTLAQAVFYSTSAVVSSVQRRFFYTNQMYTSNCIDFGTIHLNYWKSKLWMLSCQFENALFLLIDCLNRLNFNSNEYPLQQLKLIYFKLYLKLYCGNILMQRKPARRGGEQWA